MLPEKRLHHIQEMECIFNQAQALLNESEILQQRWQALLPQIVALENYYFGEQWREDYDASEQGEIPHDMPCGILSEDGIFNFTIAKRDHALEWLKLTVAMLENNE